MQFSMTALLCATDWGYLQTETAMKDEIAHDHAQVEA
jgi:hypothetical protein